MGKYEYISAGDNYFKQLAIRDEKHETLCMSVSVRLVITYRFQV